MSIAQAGGAASATPEDAVAALWRALSNEAGARADVTTLAHLFHADAMVYGGRYVDGKPALKTTTAAKFVESQSAVSEKPFYECEVHRAVERYANFATVYSVVESRTRARDGAPDFTGVNSIQLYLTDAGWKIVSLYYHVEAKGVPLPLASGKSGQCLN